MEREMGRLANGFGLLRLPHMREMWRDDTSAFVEVVVVAGSNDELLFTRLLMSPLHLTVYSSILPCCRTG